MTENYTVNSTRRSKNVVVATTVVFATTEIITNGGLLLLLLLLRRKVRRYASLVQISILASVVIKAITDLSMRLPLVVIGSTNINPIACFMMSQIPDFTMTAILLSLPLISAERLGKLLIKANFSRKTFRQIFITILSMTYLAALIITFIPATNLYMTEENANTKCNGLLQYGYAFPFTYTGLTLLSVLLTLVLSIAAVLSLKRQLKDFETSMSKRVIMKRGVISSIAVTVTLFLATVPFALTLQFIILCKTHQFDSLTVCPKAIHILFRVCVILQKLSFTALPVVFLVLNQPLRKQVRKLICCKALRNLNSSGHISTSTEKLSSECNVRQNDNETSIQLPSATGSSQNTQAEIFSVTKV